MGFCRTNFSKSPINVSNRLVKYLPKTSSTSLGQKSIDVQRNQNYTSIIFSRRRKSRTGDASLNLGQRRYLSNAFPGGYIRVKETGRSLGIPVPYLKRWFRKEVAKRRLSKAVAMQQHTLRILRAENRKLQDKVWQAVASFLNESATPMFLKDSKCLLSIGDICYSLPPQPQPVVC
mmetsp:Transcript_3737/g.5667  ORF Transcript_3737/g.5667 Transcript_3737/m.5667 type:complete len:176 (-) Transcript_3737:529-1056(-)